MFRVVLITGKAQLERAHEIRIKVFVDEQHAPPESEIDEIDPLCTHWLLEHSNGMAVGTIRLVPISDTECALGRLCISKEYRGKGLGRMLVSAFEQGAIAKKYKTISLHAQQDKIGFYEKLGYQLLPLPSFIEDGIPHVHMKKMIE